ncbi:MAG: M1 family metallopeptidase [Sphingomonadaceae bacterium]|nr:M1 family metallopeptidase [Sphingomonadaceae bacterium]
MVLAALTPSLIWASIGKAQDNPTPGFDVLAYEVSIAPDIASKSLYGAETIRLRIGREAAAELAFSPMALQIMDATLNGQPVQVRSDDKGLVFVPTNPLPAGKKVELSFRLSGTPKRGINAVPGGIYSAYFACDWMVCRQDTPGDKARLTLDIVVPKGSLAVGPGKLLSVGSTADGLPIQRWRTARDYSSYLYGFAVGPFKPVHYRRRGNRITLWNATGEAQDLEARFAQSAPLIDFLSDKAGLPMPGRYYAQILVPGWQAQEAATYSLIGQKALDADLATPDQEWILVHEMAHQWWGNLVTCANWQHFWLNEGFATFMTAAWKEHRYGREAYDAELDVARRRLAKAREAGFDKPLAWDGKYPSLGTRRAVQYSKGALFLDHLRSEMGEDAFWAGIKRYTRRHAGGTVTSADFQRAMQQETRRDLAPLFAEWVYGKAGAAES